MKKSLLIAALICFISLPFAFGQTIPNPGFESWVNHGNYKDPAGWGTINYLTAAYGFYPVTKDSVNFHSGTSSMKLQTTHFSLANVNVLGAATTGKITIVLTPFSYSVDSGFAANTIPQNLKGYYMDTIGGPRDSVYIVTFYTKWNAANSRRDTVAHGRLAIGTTNMTGWTPFTLPINIDSVPTVFPDSGYVVFQSSRIDTATAGSTLWVDDLSLTTGIDEIDPLNANYDLYPNPVAGTLFISNNNFFKKEAIINIFDEMGKNVSTANLNQDITTVNTKFLASGIYFYQIVSLNQTMMKKGKFIVQ